MVVRASMYLRERIVNLRLKKLFYKKIRLELLLEEIKISKISIGKIFFIKLACRCQKIWAITYLNKTTMLIYLDKLIVDDRKISVFKVISKINEKFSLMPNRDTILRAATKLKWKKKKNKVIKFLSDLNLFLSIFSFLIQS